MSESPITPLTPESRADYDVMLTTPERPFRTEMLTLDTPAVVEGVIASPDQDGLGDVEAILVTGLTPVETNDLVAAMAAGRAVLDARAALDAAERAKRAAEAAFVEAAAAAGITAIGVGDDEVRVEVRPRRAISVDVLARHLDADVLARLLKEEVSPKAFDAAVTMGLITPEVADEAVTVSYSTQVRVY